MTPTSDTPADLGDAGAALWLKVTGEFDLAEHELELLRQACSTLDSICRLQEALDDADVIDVSPQGRRVHPALPELRQQRVVFARLIVQLGFPEGLEEDEPVRRRPRRSTRGAYRMRSVG